MVTSPLTYGWKILESDYEQHTYIQTPNVTYGSERGYIDVKKQPTSKFRKRLRYKTNHTWWFCFKLMISAFYLNLFLNLLVAFWRLFTPFADYIEELQTSYSYVLEAKWFYKWHPILSTKLNGIFYFVSIGSMEARRLSPLNGEFTGVRSHLWIISQCILFAWHC